MQTILVFTILVAAGLITVKYFKNQLSGHNNCSNCRYKCNQKKQLTNK